MAPTLYRIPLLLITAASMNLSFNRPIPVVPNEQRRMSKYVVEMVFSRFTSSLTNVARTVTFFPALCEICIILHASRDALPTYCVRYLSIIPLQQSGLKPAGVPLAILSGAAIAVSSAYLRIWAMRTLGRHFTLELTLQPTHKLVTTAPYSVVRHPGYAGALGVLVGVTLAFCAPHDGWVRAVWCPSLTSPETSLAMRICGIAITGTILCMAALATAAFLLRPSVEDRMLRERFGREWDAWRTRVPYKLIPGVF